MPVSFAGPECESEGLKSPCAGGGSHPQNYPLVTLVARAPSASAEDQWREPKFTTRPRETAARERRSVRWKESGYSAATRRVSSPRR
jgi:hypothetical protein